MGDNFGSKFRKKFRLFTPIIKANPASSGLCHILVGNAHHKQIKMQTILTNKAEKPMPMVVVAGKLRRKNLCLSSSSAELTLVANDAALAKRRQKDAVRHWERGMGLLWARGAAGPGSILLVLAWLCTWQGGNVPAQPRNKKSAKMCKKSEKKMRKRRNAVYVEHGKRPGGKERK